MTDKQELSGLVRLCEDLYEAEFRVLELEAKLASLRDPILTAEAFGVEEIIDPRDTRPLLIEFARRAYEIVEAEARGPKGRGMRP